MEKILITQLEKGVWDEVCDGEKRVYNYYYGKVKELNGSDIVRDVIFMFDTLGKHITIKDIIIPIIFTVVEEDLSIDALKENAELLVEAHRTEDNENARMAFSILPVK